MANEDRKKKEQGILSNLQRGLAEGFRITPEEKRELIFLLVDLTSLSWELIQNKTIKTFK